MDLNSDTLERTDVSTNRACLVDTCVLFPLAISSQKQERLNKEIYTFKSSSSSSPAIVYQGWLEKD